MAIAFDNGAGGNMSASTSLTFSKTNTGSDLMLLVGAEADGAADVLTGMTYNGVSMTAAKVTTSVTGNYPQYVYCLPGPATGANNVVISFSSSRSCRAIGLSYTGVKQSTTLDNTGTVAAPGGTSPLVSTITPVADNCWMVIWGGVQRTPTMSTGGTLRSNAGGDGAWIGGDNNAAIHPAASTSINMTFATAGGPEIATTYVTIEPKATTINYTITAALGAYTLTGIAALFNVALTMTAALGTYTLTGINALFSIGKGLIASAGSYVLTGVGSNFNVALSMIASAGSLTLTGIAATLTYGRVMLADLGSYILSGKTVRFPLYLTREQRHSATLTTQGRHSTTLTNENRSNV